jgi:CDGSH-type Zn-finger protein
MGTGKMTNTVFVKENSYLKISGNFILKDASGNIMQKKDEAYICRCGASAKMPFCDGSHKKTGVKK